MTVVEIQNQKKYMKELRSSLNTICKVGASVLKSTEEASSVKKSFQLCSSLAVYSLKPKQASDQFRYWIATNQDNYKGVLTFFNLVNENKFVKETNKIQLASIVTNQRIYVPMLAPRLTLEEQFAYDDMTDDKFAELKRQRP